MELKQGGEIASKDEGVAVNKEKEKQQRNKETATYFLIASLTKLEGVFRLQEEQMVKQQGRQRKRRGRKRPTDFDVGLWHSLQSYNKKRWTTLSVTMGEKKEVEKEE